MTYWTFRLRSHINITLCFLNWTMHWLFNWSNIYLLLWKLLWLIYILKWLYNLWLCTFSMFLRCQIPLIQYFLNHLFFILYSLFNAHLLLLNLWKLLTNNCRILNLLKRIRLIHNNFILRCKIHIWR